MIININSNIAVAHSINAAIFLQQLSQWTFLNLANNRHIYDGHVWSFNTLDAYATIFPFWNRRQLETLINNLVNEGLILKGNYNKHKYDRTCWYALTYKSLNFFPELMKPEFLDAMLGLISQKCEMETPDFGGNTIMEIHFTKMRNGNHENVTPIPTYYTTKESISKDIHTPYPQAGDMSALSSLSPRQKGTNPRSKGTNPRAMGTNPKAINKQSLGSSEGFDDFWSIYPIKKSRKNCEIKWKKMNLVERMDEILLALRNQITNDDQWKRGYIPNPLTYLNGELWNDEIVSAKPTGSHGSSEINKPTCTNGAGMEYDVSHWS